MDQQKTPAKDGGQQGLTGADLSGASVESGSGAEVGRQSGQQREHGHMSREDQQRDRGGKDGSGTDRVSGHPDTNPESVRQGTNGGTGK